MKPSFTLNKTIACAATVISVSLLVAACGGGGGSSSATPAQTLSSVLNDAPPAGVCYNASPSNLSGVTDASGSFKYQTGDTVSFWIDGSGSGCVSATSASNTSIQLGSYVPTGEQTFVLNLTTGQPTSEILMALNHAVSNTNSMDVSNLVIAPAQVAKLNSFITSNGTLPSGSGSVDLLFQDVQSSTVLSGGTAPAYATSLTKIGRAHV